MMEASEKDGWFVDQGGLESEQTNAATGDTFTFGWRCSPRMAWYGLNWGEYGRADSGCGTPSPDRPWACDGPDQSLIPPYHYGP